MSVLWVNRVSGTPQLRDFDTTMGLGPPLCIDVTTGILYYLSLTGTILSLGGRRLQPEIFGAKGDGATGDYAAFKAMRIAVNLMGGAEIDLTYGKTYYIERYVGDGLGTAANDLMFDALGFLKFNGNGAKIDINGNFNRAVVATQPLSGIKVRNSTRVTIRDLEIDGNVDQMTKAGGVTEPSAHGVYLVGCDQVELTNIETHHNAGDGLYTGRRTTPVASRRVSGKGVNSHHNARNALTLTEVRDFSFESCNFSDSGQSSGTYGQHSPCASLDIEPNYWTGSAAPNTMDVNCGNGVFKACEFNNSKGYILSAANPDTIEQITFENCVGSAPAGLSPSINAVYFDINGGLMDNCLWDCGAQAFALTSVNASAITSNVELRSTTIKGTGDLIHCTTAAASAKIKGCRLISTTTIPFIIGGSKNYLLKLDCANLVFDNNYAFVPKEAFNREGAGDYHEIMQTGNVLRGSLNRFETDLPKTQSGATTAHFSNAFTAGNTSPIFDDHYKGTAPGITDTWRPVKNDTFDDTGYYNRNH